MFRLKRNIATRMWFSLKGRRRDGHFSQTLGYSLEQLREHLERLFQSGMSWENYGEWHVDHKRPVASYRFESEHDDDFKACWALDNLQPLWAVENLQKGARIA